MPFLFFFLLVLAVSSLAPLGEGIDPPCSLRSHSAPPLWGARSVGGLNARPAHFFPARFGFFFNTFSTLCPQLGKVFHTFPRFVHSSVRIFYQFGADFLSIRLGIFYNNLLKLCQSRLYFLKIIRKKLIKLGRIFRNKI